MATVIMSYQSIQEVTVRPILIILPWDIMCVVDLSLWPFTTERAAEMLRNIWFWFGTWGYGRCRSPHIDTTVTCIVKIKSKSSVFQQIQQFEKLKLKLEPKTRKSWLLNRKIKPWIDAGNLWWQNFPKIPLDVPLLPYASHTIIFKIPIPSPPLSSFSWTLFWFYLHHCGSDVNTLLRSHKLQRVQKSSAHFLTKVRTLEAEKRDFQGDYWSNRFPVARWAKKRWADIKVFKCQFL